MMLATLDAASPSLVGSRCGKTSSVMDADACSSRFDTTGVGSYYWQPGRTHASRHETSRHHLVGSSPNSGPRPPPLAPALAGVQPLAPDIEVRLSGVAAADVADAEAALMRLAHRSAGFPSLEALARRLLRSEAIASSWIEALRVSHRHLAEAEQGAPGGRDDEAGGCWATCVRWTRRWTSARAAVP